MTVGLNQERMQEVFSDIAAYIKRTEAEISQLRAELSTSYEKGAESMRERVLKVVEYVGSNHCYCIDRETCSSCRTVDEVLTDLRALPLKENEG